MGREPDGHAHWGSRDECRRIYISSLTSSSSSGVAAGGCALKSIGARRTGSDYLPGCGDIWSGRCSEPDDRGSLGWIDTHPANPFSQNRHLVVARL